MTGTTYKVPGHECKCEPSAMVRIHGKGPWLCLSAVNSGRDWEREDILARAETLVGLVMARTNMDRAFLKVFAAGVRAFAADIAAKRHVTE